jgi:hypothetical protein
LRTSQRKTEFERAAEPAASVVPSCRQIGPDIVETLTDVIRDDPNLRHAVWHDAGDASVRTVLAVDEPEKLAENCWDAGFTVLVDSNERDETQLSVIDRRGRRIQLVRRRSRRSDPCE